MILRDTRETYGGDWRLLTYETASDGTLAPKLQKSTMDGIIDTYYAQRDQELRRLYVQLFDNKISPLAFFMTLQRVTVDDMASRMKLRKSKVKAHMTPKGFDKATVDQLRRYARVFDLSVGDFFEFTRVRGELEVKVRHGDGRIVQEVTVRHDPE